MGFWVRDEVVPRGFRVERMASGRSFFFFFLIARLVNLQGEHAQARFYLLQAALVIDIRDTVL